MLSGEEKTEEKTEEKMESSSEKETEPAAKEPESDKAEESTAQEKPKATADAEQQEENEEKAEGRLEQAPSEEAKASQKDDSDDSEPQGPAAEGPAVDEESAKEESGEKAETGRNASDEKTEPAEQGPVTDKAVEKAESETAEDSQASREQIEAESNEPSTEDADGATEQKAETRDDTEVGKGPPAGEVSGTIQKMTQSAAVLPGESAGISLAMCAKDIMQKEVVWGAGDDSVEQALAKMQQANSGYMIVGGDGALEGIVSKSDLTGAISPYLRPVFAKWRRPLDDATLQIKIKWIMSRPVRTVKPETPLSAVIGNMCQFGGCVLPVVDKDDKVQGLVTIFDILQALLSDEGDFPTVGKTAQSPPLA